MNLFYFYSIGSDLNQFVKTNIFLNRSPETLLHQGYQNFVRSSHDSGVKLSRPEPVQLRQPDQLLLLQRDLDTLRRLRLQRTQLQGIPWFWFYRYNSVFK